MWVKIAELEDTRKVGGLGTMVKRSDDVEADMAVVKAFYSTIKGRNASQFAAE